jgi:transcriptional regulator with XRE-family HTH domain
MSKSREKKLHYLAEWRRFRSLSQQRLVLRMEREPGEEVLSTASLSRIENGTQSMSAELAHAFAHALDCAAEDLFGVNPLLEPEVVDLLAVIRQLREGPKSKILQATNVLRAIA